MKQLEESRKKLKKQSTQVPVQDFRQKSTNVKSPLHSSDILRYLQIPSHTCQTSGSTKRCTLDAMSENLPLHLSLRHLHVQSHQTYALAIPSRTELNARSKRKRLISGELSSRFSLLHRFRLLTQIGLGFAISSSRIKQV